MASITPYFDDARELSFTVGTGGVTGGQLVASSSPGDRIAVTAGATPDARTIVGQALESAAGAQTIRALIF